MVGWHHELSRHEFEQAPGEGEGQGSLSCCSPWGRKESDMNEQLKTTTTTRRKRRGRGEEKDQGVGSCWPCVHSKVLVRWCVWCHEIFYLITKSLLMI